MTHGLKSKVLGKLNGSAPGIEIARSLTSPSYADELPFPKSRKGSRLGIESIMNPFRKTDGDPPVTGHPTATTVNEWSVRDLKVGSRISNARGGRGSLSIRQVMPNGLQLSGGVPVEGFLVSRLTVPPIARHDDAGTVLCRIEHEGNKPIRLQPIVGSKQIEPLQATGRLAVK